MRTIEYKVDISGAKKRIDQHLAEIQSELSRSRIKQLIDDQHITVNGVATKCKSKLQTGDIILLQLPDPAPLDIPAEAMALDIVFEDDAIVLVNKAPGMVIHPAPGHSSGTLVNALLAHCPDLPGIGGVERPGIVHRLDKDTSGLVLVAKTDAAHKSLCKQFKNREIKKVYLALVKGKVKNATGSIQSSIGRHKQHRKKMATGLRDGREAHTDYEVIQHYGHFTFVRLFIKTGRTHQIRVHMASLSHPVLGDSLYGGKLDAKFMRMPRQALHAHRLEFSHPENNKWMQFEALLPKDMEEYLLSHSKENG
jgi:23S rRNA pseudouridine1911/1915/1917 synthase